MSSSSLIAPRIGIVGLGAFGQLIARHLSPHFPLCAYDPFLPAEAFEAHNAARVPLAELAGCPIVILAMPVPAFAQTVKAIAPHLTSGTLVVDVGSVKTLPVRIMQAHLPSYVDILATHPLFGPQSARAGIAGLKIAVCSRRGGRGLRAAAFLRKTLGLRVIFTTPEAHDLEAATVQGLTHLIAKVLVKLEPLPTRMTTRSFELLMQAVEMVRYDAPEVFQAVEQSNPFAADVRERFVAVANQLNGEL